jgi:SNF2 family DNA or RNA helicase
MTTPEQFILDHPLVRPRWPHQVEGFKFAANHTACYLAAEQRTGKTQIVMDWACYLHEQDKIGAMVVASMPSAAPRNWEEELGSNYPGQPPSVLRWEATKFKNVSFQNNLETTLNPSRNPDRLKVLLINGEGTATDNFLDFIGTWLRSFKRKVLIVYDEGTLLIKTPGNVRTKIAYKLRNLCSYATVLDGTPSGEGPLDLFSQYKFLNPGIIGISSFTAFKARYAVLEDGFNHKTKTSYKAVKRDEDGDPIYQHLDELSARTDPYTFRVRFRDVFKDVPEPVYSKRFVELTPKQRETYDRLETEYEAELQNLGTVTVANVLTRYLRLQQVTSGFWPSDKAAMLCGKCEGEGCGACDELGVVERDVPLQRLVSFDDNPRLNALRDELTYYRGAPAVIWCRFNQDIDDVMTLCRDLGCVAVQYDGRVEEKQKALNKASFQEGYANIFVAKTRSAGRAVSLSRAERMIYYSSEFGLNQRLQSEVRAETGLRTIATQIVDLVANNTKDELILSSHRARRKLSDIILKEKSGKWL